MSGEHPYDELAVGWALHALEPEDDARFARHLPGCDRCARTVAETSEVMAAMARDLPAAEPSPALRDRLRAAVEETEQLPPRGAAAPAPLLPRGEEPASPPARRRLLPMVLVAAAVASVVGLGVWVAALDRARDDLRATVAAQEQVVAELLRPGRAAIAPLADDERQVATVVARDGAVQVVIDGLAPNDASSSTYVLWGLGAGDPVALGTFDVERSQMEVENVGSEGTGLDGFPEYGISIEPGRQAPSTPTEVVATGQVAS
ncbi:anti-sigma factor [Blastococcus sp. MG754426]|uniref:anti-sigma factor n=1 Tax=unclassified Blastococcus TaxID=2619396 RepID=UPI001EF075D4|nr:MULTISPECIES: anti-sigma factor [unclassified Blastococcus]MCF6507527.1 anti-sigma factor [Blastococcus sp. MG754426]MCF6512089.1 anti-sigma factor [Blastococcus sp. MG754427]